MSEHGKKMIAPIVVTAIVLLYYILYFSIIVFFIRNIVVTLLFGIIPLALGAVMIGVCIQRIKEIKGGEEDDLSKY
ncbi:MAG: hypothetical protein K6A74_08240 [Lachnospiraceae bacterium]|nr:hypothetical protein [Lachnospiraceae bacterium]